MAVADLPMGITASRALVSGKRPAAPPTSPPPARQGGEAGAAILSSSAGFGVTQRAALGLPDAVERTGNDSFPASDPPGWIGATIGRLQKSSVL